MAAVSFSLLPFLSSVGIFQAFLSSLLLSSAGPPSSVGLREETSQWHEILYITFC